MISGPQCAVYRKDGLLQAREAPLRVGLQDTVQEGCSAPIFSVSHHHRGHSSPTGSTTPAATGRVRNPFFFVPESSPNANELLRKKAFT